MFNKLKQVTTVVDYEDKFEELRAIVLTKKKGFTEEYYISRYISGLKDYIKNFVRMFRPQTQNDVVFLAKQEEARTRKMSPTFVKSHTQTSSGDVTTPHKSDTKFEFLAQSQTSPKIPFKAVPKPKSTLSSKKLWRDGTGGSVSTVMTLTTLDNMYS